MSRAPLAVITGGHPFDVRGFHAFVRAVAGERFEPYVQHLEEFATSTPEERRAYAAALFYCFPQGRPDSGAGDAIAGLLDQGQGVVVLHHALLAYADWPLWDEVVGCRGRGSFSFHPGSRVAVGIAEPRHPVTAGLGGWEMTDETYVMPDPEGEPLLVTAHPRSTRIIGWARTCRRSRVACLQPGHDAHAWTAPGFVAAAANAVAWTGQADAQASAALA